MPLARKSAPVGDSYSSMEREDNSPSRKALDLTFSGWEGSDELMRRVRKSSGSSQYFRFETDAALVCFVPAQTPLTSFQQHWVTTPDGLRPFRCWDGEGSCPLCDEGDMPKPQFVFWIVDFVDSDGVVSPVSKVLTAGIRLKNTLRDIDSDPRKGGPLAGSFFSLHKTGTGQSTQQHVSHVKARDLDEDWGLDKDEANTWVQDISRGDPPSLYIPSYEDLQKAAQHLRKS